MADPLISTVDVRADGFSVAVQGGSWLEQARMLVVLPKAICKGLAEASVASLKADELKAQGADLAAERRVREALASMDRPKGAQDEGVPHD